MFRSVYKKHSGRRHTRLSKRTPKRLRSRIRPRHKAPVPASCYGAEPSPDSVDDVDMQGMSFVSAASTEQPKQTSEDVSEGTSDAFDISLDDMYQVACRDQLKYPSRGQDRTYADFNHMPFSRNEFDGPAPPFITPHTDNLLAPVHSPQPPSQGPSPHSRVGASLENLPPELQHRIFKLDPQWGVWIRPFKAGRLIMISRAVRTEAECVQYYDITLKKKKGLALLLRTLLQRPTLGRYTRILRFYDANMPIDSEWVDKDTMSLAQNFVDSLDLPPDMKQLWKQGLHYDSITTEAILPVVVSLMPNLMELKHSNKGEGKCDLLTKILLDAARREKEPLAPFSNLGTVSISSLQCDLLYKDDIWQNQWAKDAQVFWSLKSLVSLTMITGDTEHMPWPAKAAPKLESLTMLHVKGAREQRLQSLLSRTPNIKKFIWTRHLRDEEAGADLLDLDVVVAALYQIRHSAVHIELYLGDSLLEQRRRNLDIIGSLDGLAEMTHVREMRCPLVFFRDVPGDAWATSPRLIHRLPRNVHIVMFSDNLEAFHRMHKPEIRLRMPPAPVRLHSLAQLMAHFDKALLPNFRIVKVACNLECDGYKYPRIAAKLVQWRGMYMGFLDHSSLDSRLVDTEPDAERVWEFLYMLPTP